MLLGPGIHTLTRDPDPNKPFLLDYASVSAPATTEVSVKVNDVEVEHVFVGPYSPHTWWANNALLDEVAPGDAVTITVGGGAIMRVETNLTLIP